MSENQYSIKEAILFSQRIAQLSKAVWKVVEKDWQEWIKPYDLNINEHHILWIAFHLNGASISDVANFGVMHVSTAYNFSKKLEERGLLHFSKKENDKRNTYIKLTTTGEEILLQTMEAFDPTNNTLFSATLPMKNIYGKFPEFIEMMAIVRNIYGEEFMKIFKHSFDNIENDFTEAKGKLSVKTKEIVGEKIKSN